MVRKHQGVSQALTRLRGDVILRVTHSPNTHTLGHYPVLTAGQSSSAPAPPSAAAARPCSSGCGCCTPAGSWWPLEPVLFGSRLPAACRPLLSSGSHGPAFSATLCPRQSGGKDETEMSVGDRLKHAPDPKQDVHQKKLRNMFQATQPHLTNNNQRSFVKIQMSLCI